MSRLAALCAAFVLVVSLSSCVTASGLIEKKEYAKAYELLIGTSRSPERTAQLQKLGGIHFADKRYAEARACFAASGKDEAEGLSAYGDYAVAFKLPEREYERSQKHRDEALRAYREAGAWEKAKGLVERLPVLVFMDGWSAQRLKREDFDLAFPDPKSAKTAWAKLMYPKAVEEAPLFRLDRYLRFATALEEAGDTEFASAAWREILKRYGSYDTLERKLENLASCMGEGSPAFLGHFEKIARDSIESWEKSSRYRGDSRLTEAYTVAKYGIDPELRFRIAEDLARARADFTEISRADSPTANTGMNALRGFFSFERKDPATGKATRVEPFDKARVDRVLLELALRYQAPWEAARLKEALGDTEAARLARLAIADTELEKRLADRYSKYEDYAASLARTYAVSAGSETEGWKLLGERLAAKGLAALSVEAYRKTGDKALVAAALPGAARAELAAERGEAAAALFNEAGMVEEARSALLSRLVAMYGSDYETFMSERAEPLFTALWGSTTAGKKALADAYAENENAYAAIELAQELDDPAAVHRYQVLAIGERLADELSEIALEEARGFAKTEKEAQSLLYEAHVGMRDFNGARRPAIAAGRKTDLLAFLKGALKPEVPAAERRKAAASLVLLASPEARAILAPLAKDKDPAIALLAAWSAGKGPKSPKVRIVISEAAGRLAMTGMAVDATLSVGANWIIAKERLPKGDYEFEASVAKATGVTPAPTTLEGALKAAEGSSTEFDETAFDALKAQAACDIMVISRSRRYENSRSIRDPVSIRVDDGYEIYLPACGLSIPVPGEGFKFVLDINANETLKDIQTDKGARVYLAERKARLSELGGALRFLRGL